VESFKRWALDLRNDFDDEYEDDFDDEDEPPRIERYGTIRSSGFRLLCAGHEREILKALFITMLVWQLIARRHESLAGRQEQVFRPADLKTSV
jgi:hypothetical protein